MSLTYNLTLNTQNTSNIIDTSNGKNAYKYYINWDAILNRHFQEYNLIWTLKSVNTSTSLSENLFVDINFGSVNNYEQSNQMSSKIGFVYPNAVQQTSTTWSYFYQSTIYDNPGSQISYPSNNIITVKLYKFDNSAPTTNLDYVLELSFIPIMTNLIL